jgi:hypothetical protein
MKVSLNSQPFPNNDDYIFLKLNNFRLLRNNLVGFLILSSRFESWWGHHIFSDTYGVLKHQNTLVFNSQQSPISLHLLDIAFHQFPIYSQSVAKLQQMNIVLGKWWFLITELITCVGCEKKLVG